MTDPIPGIDAMRTGGCHCGAVRYVATGQAAHHALCHCGDCRRWPGAPMAGWLDDVDALPRFATYPGVD